MIFISSILNKSIISDQQRVDFRSHLYETDHEDFETSQIYNSGATIYWGRTLYYIKFYNATRIYNVINYHAEKFDDLLN